MDLKTSKLQISDSMFLKFRDFILANTGLYFSENNFSALGNGLLNAMKDLKFTDEQSCVAWLLSGEPSKEQIEILASYLTVGETYFFREKASIEALQQLMVKLISERENSGRYLRIWSAACCTGEEPYTIAILLHKLISNLEEWNIQLLATDINPLFLEKAKKGGYTEWSFRECPEWIKETYFKKNNKDQYELDSKIKKMVTFSYLNLAKDFYPSLLSNTNAMDIILCRNVLIYFNDDHKKNVIQKLFNSLTENGRLIVSVTEAYHDYYPQFVVESFPSTTFFKKDSTKNQTNIELLLSKKNNTKLPIEPIVYEEIIVPVSETSERKEELVCGSTETMDEIINLSNEGYYEAAIKKITDYLAYDSNNKDAILLLARTYANQGKLSEAYYWCQKAIEIDKVEPISYYLIATVQIEQGLIDDAKSSLNKALFLNQEFILAHYILGNIALKEEKRKEARKHFKNTFDLLKRYKKEDIILESEGLTAGRLCEIIESSLQSEE